MGETGGNRVDWDYLKRLATLKALCAGEGDITLDDASRLAVTRNLHESTSAPAAPVKQSYSRDPCAGGCIGIKTGCTYSHCWG